MNRRTFTKRFLLLGMTMLLVLLAACGRSEQPDAKRQAQAEQPAAQVSESGTVELENMGEKLSFPDAPKRAVTLNQHATEVMLALGLEDSMVGTAYLDDSILPEYKEKYDKIPVLADKYPSKEVFLSVSPDFAYAGWKSAFGEKALGSRADLAGHGVLTYVQESSNKPAPTLEDVYQDIMNIGRIFRVEDRAEAVVNDLRKKLEDIQAQIGSVSEPLNVFVFDSGEDKAFTAANTYLTSLIAKVGGKNIFDDIEKGWAEVSWEEVVNRDPDVIVIVDYGDTTAEQKRELLLNKAPLADVKAIKNKRFIMLPLSAAAEGIRAPIALQTLAAGLYPDKVQP
ncbi:ABC transporter substrate-binding protein [Paenibacillus melissococcoides]|uniref:ABC transporter substrate-binding protein n=1 Tax=Paenibacillus melissococcoides TaxID=2912268 RepID=A0ABN8TZE6_9BACL|nr:MULTISPECIES: ABC transporter substrate-binding protein [Paenibacillus]MEB9893683.1 ABC transporter substrate-binding protein [Bacillus cereus]CAH8244170.1 ABC transporter substrate-binding protein [Paenibacillus melissococcoides]CAH8703729.1 ABC transporter substrate-binding protein [Paenibacillus melissococcoides]CAH8706248.1 ABC transporter substrate-binding protein [Paenibacillus melissococcoides]GIO77771.1 lipoprotein [Paenibacillus dendritiformis]